MITELEKKAVTEIVSESKGSYEEWDKFFKHLLIDVNYKRNSAYVGKGLWVDDMLDDGPKQR